MHSRLDLHAQQSAALMSKNPLAVSPRSEAWQLTLDVSVDRPRLATVSSLSIFCALCQMIGTNLLNPLDTRSRRKLHSETSLPNFD